jgi:hypothetical protein
MILKNLKIGITEIEILRKIWKNQKHMMNLPEDRGLALKMVIEEIFNPSRKRSSLLELTNRMPILNDFPKEDVKNLERQGYIISIPMALGNRLTITPEGIITIEGYGKDVQHGENFEKIAYDSYRKHCFHKIERLRKKEDLKPKHIGILLFFLLNGSIGKKKSYQVRSYEDSLCLEKIVRSYMTDEHITIEDNYALKYFLVEAKRILGDIAFNRKPHYYLKEETLDYVLDSIRNQVKGDAAFKERWARLKREYKENITFLRMRKNSNYATSWEMELNRKLLEGS